MKHFMDSHLLFFLASLSMIPLLRLLGQAADRLPEWVLRWLVVWDFAVRMRRNRRGREK
jgi:hypothetical protein